MSREDWYRNADWNDTIEAEFMAKLRRARDKAQYLKIQAHILSKSRPKISLRLLDQYFATGDQFFLSDANVVKAEAHLALNEIEKAVESYLLALARETAFPNTKTNAYVDFPFLVAVNRLSHHYESALQTLNDRSRDLAFPLNHFKFHTARALIYAAQGNIAGAREHAEFALSAASAQNSGFRNHPNLGLVGSKYESIRSQLSSLASA